MVILMAAIMGLVAGTAFGFTSVFALCERFGWKRWIAMATAAMLSIPIGIVAGGLLAAALISVMYPDFNWKR